MGKRGRARLPFTDSLTELYTIFSFAVEGPLADVAGQLLWSGFDLVIPLIIYIAARFRFTFSQLLFCLHYMHDDAR